MKGLLSVKKTDSVDMPTPEEMVAKFTKKKEDDTSSKKGKGKKYDQSSGNKGKGKKEDIPLPPVDLKKEKSQVKKVFLYEKRLEQLDKVIKEGVHPTWVQAKEKEELKVKRE